ncbi:hypothetical protein [Nocardia sp. CNY236]|nr:hypothetical protein [Nocardia sp. CNY236]
MGIATLLLTFYMFWVNNQEPPYKGKHRVKPPRNRKNKKKRRRK